MSDVDEYAQHQGHDPAIFRAPDGGCIACARSVMTTLETRLRVAQEALATALSAKETETRQLREALSLAKSMILSGERMSDVAASMIQAALSNVPSGSQR